MEPYPDRRAAGRDLATHLDHHREARVIGISSGAVVIADEVASMIGGTLGVAPVRRLGAPESPNLVVGAVSFDGEVLLDEDLTRRLSISREDLHDQVVRAQAVIHAELDALGADPPQLAGCDVIVVSEGATGGITLRAALASARRAGAARVTGAVPVAPPVTVDLIAAEVDEVVCPRQPLRLGSIETWYSNFPPVGRDEVRRILQRW